MTMWPKLPNRCIGAPQRQEAVASKNALKRVSRDEVRLLRQRPLARQISAKGKGHPRIAMVERPLGWAELGNRAAALFVHREHSWRDAWPMGADTDGGQLRGAVGVNARHTNDRTLGKLTA